MEYLTYRYSSFVSKYCIFEPWFVNTIKVLRYPLYPVFLSTYITTFRINGWGRENASRFLDDRFPRNLMQISKCYIKFCRQDNQFLSVFMIAPWELQRHHYPFCLRGLLSYRIDRSICRINSEEAFLILRVSHLCLSWKKPIARAFEYLPIP